MDIIKKEQTDSSVTYAVSGRLDTVTAPALEAELNTVSDGITELNLDFKTLDYISSAGLRVLLSQHKKMMAKKGSLVIRNTNEIVSEIFDVTGFADILTIK